MKNQQEVYNKFMVCRILNNKWTLRTTTLPPGNIAKTTSLNELLLHFLITPAGVHTERGNGKVCVRPDPGVNILLYALDNKSVTWFNLVFSFL